MKCRQVVIVHSAVTTLKICLQLQCKCQRKASMYNRSGMTLRASGDLHVSPAVRPTSETPIALPLWGSVFRRLPLDLSFVVESMLSISISCPSSLSCSSRGAIRSARRGWLAQSFHDLSHFQHGRVNGFWVLEAQQRARSYGKSRVPLFKNSIADIVARCPKSESDPEEDAGHILPGLR